MKRIISLILTISLFHSLLTFPSFAEGYSYPENYEDMKGLLSAVEIIGENYGEASKLITREEFVTLIAKSTGIAPMMPSDADSLFSDVEKESENAKYIYLAKELNLVSGYSDGTFKPNDNISLTEGIVCAVNLLGYSVMAREFGGFPTGYMTLANDIGLYKNLKDFKDAKLTYGAAAILIYNTLNSKTLKIETVSQKGIAYKSYTGQTLLYDNFGISLIEGVMDGTDMSRLRGLNDIPPYKVSIAGKLLRQNETNAQDFLGYFVQGWYKEINGQDSLIYISKKAGKNIETEIEIEDITNISGYKIYADFNTSKIEAFPYTAYSAIIYNGVSTGFDFNMSILKDENGNLLNGTVKLLDNDADGKCDVIFIDAYYEYVAGRIEKSEGRIYDYFDPQKSIIMDTSIDEPYTLLYNTDGEEIGVNKVKRFDSIMVYKTKSDAMQTIHKGIVSNITVTGVISMITEENGINYYVLNGVNYPVTKELLNNKKAILNREITLTLNAKGKGVYFTYTGEDSVVWGMLIKAKENITHETHFYLQLMNENGAKETFEAADTIKIDGIRYSILSDINTIKAHLEEAFMQNNFISDSNGLGYVRDTDDDKINQMVKYSLNSEGKIKYIDTCLQYYNPSLTPKYEVTTRMTSDGDNEVFMVKINDNTSYQGYYSKYDYTVGGKAYISADAKVFLYPVRGTNNEEHYMIKDRQYIADLDRMDIKAYYDNKESLTCKVFLKDYTENAINTTTISILYSVVVKSTDVINKDGEPRKKLYLINNGVETSVVARDDLMDTSGTKSISTLKPGDLIYYTESNITGEMEAFQLRFDIDTKTIIADTNKKNSHYSYLGYALGAFSDGIVTIHSELILNDNIDDEDDLASVMSEFDNGNFRIVMLPSIPVTIIDLSKPYAERFTQGNISSFDTLLQSGKDADRILIHYYATEHYMKEIFIIK